MAEKKTKIDIFSGFLGAGKTTLIKKLIKEAFAGEQIVLIENNSARSASTAASCARPAFRSMS